MLGRRKGVWVLALVAVASTSTSIALAEGGAGLEVTSPGARVGTTCGALVTNEVITENAVSTTRSTSFVGLPGASVSVSVPNTACIKVLFTAETACLRSAENDSCFIRAVVNGVEMHPQGGGTQVIDSESDTRRGHAFEWVLRVGEGVYTIAVEQRVRSAATRFQIDDWTMDVMFLQ